MATLPFRNAEDGTLNVPEVTADEGRAWMPPILALSLSLLFLRYTYLLIYFQLSESSLLCVGFI